ncbi:MAG: SDR family oxidoreductase [Paludibacter sp.]|nr:SDR family oxidoreductase [Paludibacter sp.]
MNQPKIALITGVPDDIGGVIAFLCTEDARWINGQRIEVSGGMHL